MQTYLMRRLSEDEQRRADRRALVVAGLIVFWIVGVIGTLIIVLHSPLLAVVGGIAGALLISRTAR